MDSLLDVLYYHRIHSANDLEKQKIDRLVELFYINKKTRKLRLFYYSKLTWFIGQFWNYFTNRDKEILAESCIS